MKSSTESEVGLHCVRKKRPQYNNRRVYDSRHLQADCQEPGSAPEPYARQSSMGCLFYACDKIARGVTSVLLGLFGWFVWNSRCTWAWSGHVKVKSRRCSPSTAPPHAPTTRRLLATAVYSSYRPVQRTLMLLFWQPLEHIYRPSRTVIKFVKRCHNSLKKFVTKHSSSMILSSLFLVAAAMV